MMFVTLATTESPKYKGFDRACDLYTNAAISVLGKVDNATEAAWLDYIDLLDTEQIVCNEKSLAAMNRILALCEKNRRDLEVILFTKDMSESCEYPADFIGFDVAGTYYTSILTASAWRHMPERYARQVYRYGLFDTFKQASDVAQCANALTASEIEPEPPFAPVKVYILSNCFLI